MIEQKMKTEEFIDLLEDGLAQAARSLTDERRQYIASLLKNSITTDDLSHIEEKKLLSLLGELNDAEILILKFYNLYAKEQREYATKHNELFKPSPVFLGSPQRDVEKAALRKSYTNKLVQMDLLEARYTRPKKGELPDLDEKTGKLKSSGYSTNQLGRLLLKYIDLA